MAQINYSAPMCNQPGCQRHVWSMYCQDHDGTAKAERERAKFKPKARSAYSSRSTGGEQWSEISEEVRDVLPDYFTGVPTASQMEQASQSIILVGLSNSEVQREYLVRSGQVSAAEAEEMIDRRGFMNIAGRSPEDVYEAGKRFGEHGVGPEDYRLISTYLLQRSWEAHINQGDSQDSEGIDLSEDFGSYAERKQRQTIEGPQWRQLMEGDGRRYPSVAERVADMDRALSERSVRNALEEENMRRAARTLGTMRSEVPPPPVVKKWRDDEVVGLHGRAFPEDHSGLTLDESTGNIFNKNRIVVGALRDAPWLVRAGQVQAGHTPYDDDYDRDYHSGPRKPSRLRRAAGIGWDLYRSGAEARAAAQDRQALHDIAHHARNEEWRRSRRRKGSIF